MAIRKYKHSRREIETRLHKLMDLVEDMDNGPIHDFPNVADEIYDKLSKIIYSIRLMIND